MSLLAVLSVTCAYAWDFRDEVYTCGTQGMTLAELQSAGVTLVSHCPHSREWMKEAARYGIRGMPYISLYKVYDASAPGADMEHPFWCEVDMTDHPEWVYIGADGQRKRPFNNEFYPPMYWQSCTNTAGIAEAYRRGAAGIMAQGAGGVFIDNVLPAATCYGPQFGIHQHLYPELDNIETLKLALQGVQDTVHGFGPDSVVMLNIGGPFERWAPFGDCIMLESFIYNVAVRPGPGGWVGNERVQVKQWPQILEWIEQTAGHVDGGGSVVALEYLPSDPKAAFFSYAADKLANFLWTGSSDVRRDVCRTLYRCRLQRASGPLRETDGVYWRHYPNGMVALNPTDERASVLVKAPAGLSALADAATDRVLTIRGGRVRLTLGPGEAGVYVSPQALAEGHLREALVAAQTALEGAAPDGAAQRPAELSAAVGAIGRARAAMAGAAQTTAARGPVAAALRAVGACLSERTEPGLTVRLAAGEELSREEVVALLASVEDAPRVSTAGTAPTVSVGGIDWTIGGEAGLVAARGMGANLGLSVSGLHEVHGWLNPGEVMAAEVARDEPDRAVLRAMLNFVGAKTQQVIDGVVLDLEVAARAGDPMLTVTAAVRNTGEAPLPAYFVVSSAGAGTWFAAPGEPAQAGGDYLQVPHTEWTFVASGPEGGPGLLVVTDHPQSYSRYALHLYSEPRSGELAPGEARAISFRIAPVWGPWQADPRVSGALTRAQIYLSRAWSLAATGEGLPAPTLGRAAVAGRAQLVSLDAAAAARHAVELSLEGIALLDANGSALVRAEIAAVEGGHRLTTAPSLRDDLFYQVVQRVRYAPEDLPLAIAADFRPGPCVALAPRGEATWEGARGTCAWTATNRLDRDVTCQVAVSAPEGYAVSAPETLTLAPGASADLRIEVSASAATARPAEVTAALTLADITGGGELSRTAAFRPVATCPTIAAPTLDGRLDDPGWQQATQLSAFGLVVDGSAPVEPTTVRVGRDREYLYVAFECMDAQMAALVATVPAAPDQNDSAVHQDDSVEVFLDPPGELPYLQLAANALGARKTRGDAQWEVATRREADRWTVEMRVRLDSLGLPIAPGARWGANFCRVHQRTGQASCWSPTGSSFHRPERFGLLLFE
ncbi:MAG: sugar-binding protein [Armatimonadota bacterium]